ncbi:MAG: phosphoenolpyruvate--protein phosphotransferase [Planctomycetota bacterium]|nr:phosphoenolpyruvate--protein phosphotransferase [Planctomycetota bacterium]
MSASVPEPGSASPPGGGGRIVVTGLPVAPGLAVGTPVFHDETDIDIPVLALSADDVSGEQRRLATAIRMAKKQLADVEQNIEREVGRRDARIFSVQGLLLDDPAFRKAIRERIATRLVNAEVAVRDAVAAWSDRLKGMGNEADRDPVADLRDVGRQLLRILAGRPGRAAASAVEKAGADGSKVILVTRELLPSDTATMDRRRLAAIVTASGGAASHAAILARGLGIPAVTDVDVSSLPACGGPWIIDGGQGRVILNPQPEDLDQAVRQSQHYHDLREELAARASGLVRTKDGVAVEIMLNVENFDSVHPEMMSGLRGVGLFRTEFLFMERRTFPSEQEQYEYYVEALSQVGDAEITFRTIDVGGDKPLSYFSLPTEPNPVLGWRGLRLSLQWPDMFYTQIRALLRASAHGRVRILLPMVTMVEEFRRARTMIAQIQSDMQVHGVPFDEDVPVGAMVEVPAAALAARDLGEEADFLSLGTNDLSQYALAVDRNNARVASLYQPLHPGMIRLIKTAIDGAALANSQLSVCGEMAGDPDSVLLLLGLGGRSLSMSPYHLPLVRRLISAITLEEAREVAVQMLELRSTTEIRAELRGHVLRLVPELSSLLAPI